MIKAKIISLRKELSLAAVIYFIVLLSLVIVVPLFHQQAITGPVVNAILFAAVVILGAQGALLIGLIPSVVALSTGLLPPVLAPMVPFIMLGNSILILAFSYLGKKNYWLGIAVSAFLKFIFLFISSSVVINLLLKKEVAQSVASLMSWPQFITALAGGVLAYLFLKIIRRK